MGANILSERAEQTALSNMFEGLSILLQDSDDAVEKERIKKAIQGMTSTTAYLMLGETETGKSSLLRELFYNIFEVAEDMAGDVCEYRWGEQEFTMPLSDGFQKRFIASENMKGLSIIDTKGLNCFNDTTLIRVKELAENCDVVFVVLNAAHVNSSRLWDIIESFPAKKMLFFLTKCDLLPSEELAKNIDKVKCYMQESNISAPVFPVSIKEEQSADGTVPLEEVRAYIRNQVVGSNPMLRKQRQNVEEAGELLNQIYASFSMRKKQYLSDAEILRKINRSMDDYVANHQKVIDDLIKKLTVEINKDIDNYEKEIISKLDPYKIKERFKEKEDFEYYLNMTNENYKTMMSDSVNRKTIEAIKGCLHDLEIVFQEAVGYFNTRENIMELNDRFYGSLSKSRQSMAAETKETIVATGELYKTLSEASETLFLQIWDERKKYDDRIKKRFIFSVAGGGITGFFGGAGGAVGVGKAVAAGGKAVAVAGEAAAGALSASALFGAAVIGIGVALLGAFAVNALAKTLYDPRASNKMEEAAQRCIEQFKMEVGNTRVKMIEQISAQITDIFERELASADGCFTDFRMSVNIDEQRIPLLEQKLQETEKILEQINGMINRMEING
ncbi:MAG: hypothetical protein NC429_08320 [Lachnospiraceae bacterium]|nr:hypothetical protein [Lachnospiraceae bacterium]